MKVAAMLVVAVSMGVVAQPERPRRGTPEWRAMKRRIAYDRVRARFLRDEEASILRGLRDIERRLRERRREMKRLEERLERLEIRLEVLQAKRARSEAKLEALRLEAGRRAASMLRLRRTSIAHLVSTAESPVHARRLRDRFRFMLEHDAGMLRAAREADEAVYAAERSLAEERAARASARASLEREIEDEALLDEERRALAKAVRTERKAAERLVRELAVAARRLEEEMGRIRGRAPAPPPVAGGFGAQRGRLPWPTVGQVEVTFGKRVDPGSDVVLVSNGVDIRAPDTAPVRAVFPGKVVYASHFEGYGNLVIVAHDGGFFTLYAHLASFGARVDHEVNQYQVVGFVGDTGSTKGSYLYFEIRKGRSAVDPLRWLTRDS